MLTCKFHKLYLSARHCPHARRGLAHTRGNRATRRRRFALSSVFNTAASHVPRGEVPDDILPHPTLAKGGNPGLCTVMLTSPPAPRPTSPETVASNCSPLRLLLSRSGRGSLSSRPCRGCQRIRAAPSPPLSVQYADTTHTHTHTHTHTQEVCLTRLDLGFRTQCGRDHVGGRLHVDRSVPSVRRVLCAGNSLSVLGREQIESASDTQFMFTARDIYPQ
jgi:hypothetical protein